MADEHHAPDYHKQNHKKKSHPVLPSDNPHKIPVDANYSCNSLFAEETAYNNCC